MPAAQWFPFAKTAHNGCYVREIRAAIGVMLRFKGAARRSYARIDAPRSRLRIDPRQRVTLLDLFATHGNRRPLIESHGRIGVSCVVVTKIGCRPGTLSLPAGGISPPPELRAQARPGNARS